MNESEKENARPHSEPLARRVGRDTRREGSRSIRAPATIDNLVAAVYGATKEAEEAMEAAGLSRATSESIAGRVRELITAGPWAERDVTEVAYDQAQQRTFRDIDAILARLETGIAAERTAMGVLLERLTSHAAAMGVLLESGRPLRPERTSS